MTRYSTRDRSKLFKTGKISAVDIDDSAISLSKLATDVTDYVDTSVSNVSVDLTGYATETYVDTAVGAKQDTLVSGTGIKTINGTSILGSGDITISGGGSTPVEVLAPVCVTPANSLTLVAVLPELIGSTYYSLYGKTMAASHWQVSTVSNFSTVDYDYEQSGTSLSHTVGTDLLGSTQYYWRIRYKDIDGEYSEWSTAFTFTTEASNAPQLGAFYEGGYYAGKVNYSGLSQIYYIIVAPKSTQTAEYWVDDAHVNTTLQYNGNAAAGWTYLGNDNTVELVNNSSGATCDAAIACYNLSVNGYSDWYLPSGTELEICYFNLKPNTTENVTYTGSNPYSIPARSYPYQYTTTTPARTNVAIFQEGGSEAFSTSGGVNTTGLYWTSNQAIGFPVPDLQKNQTINFNNGEGSFVGTGSKAWTRAIRKVAVV